MSKQPGPEYREALTNAWSALQSKDKPKARQWALEAARLAPEQEDPWLILSAISKPVASVAYLKHALVLNPDSTRAKEGLKWATQRLGTEQTAVGLTSSPPLEPVPGEPFGQALTGAERAQSHQPGWISNVLQPVSGQDASALIPPVVLVAGSQKKKRVASWAIPLALLVIAMITWFAIPKLIANARSSAAPIQANVLGKPSLTPTLTPTSTPTLTPTATPTLTPTATATSTQTPTATNTPTRKPTKTRKPPTAIPPTEAPYEPPIQESGRWIDIDLSQQILYAFVDDTLVNSFYVSTGTYLHPTVTGQYYIYIKLRYTDMKGDGYYLPDVPYTMYFYSGYGIHGTYWHSNFGTPMSHGCVNMETSEAGWLFNWASVGTLVNIHY